MMPSLTILKLSLIRFSFSSTTTISIGPMNCAIENVM